MLLQFGDRSNYRSHAIMSASINTQLVNSLAQIILALKPEEQELLSYTVQSLRADSVQTPQRDLGHFFQVLDELSPDANQPTPEEISAEVKTVRQALWAES